MTAPASSNSSRTSFGKYLIGAATRAGRLVNQLETSVLNSSILASVPLRDAPINLSCSRGKLQFSRHLQRHWT
ncbi:hypothetical protein LU652_20025, partial [Pseudomonas monteilii]|nr:hypothetical protein [Pseudomonas monteilii]